MRPRRAPLRNYKGRKALPAALHARVLGTYRPEEEFGNDAMLLTRAWENAGAYIRVNHVTPARPYRT